ncbi:MAG TPA: hypothetical protein H9717_03510 [Candidatus Eisenbergiella merdipullorum]|uniref:Cyclophilin-like domain-containing protein n=1 Tax=Candidatus Eisenbergiella merdipullorum TaxID=2838553 RepID=A0A9D2I4N6_9FIRM|nr:hypothetical protein [Candidatus Eisenbergiella merdipullorum]
MKKRVTAIFGLVLALGMMAMGCGGSSGSAESAAGAESGSASPAADSTETDSAETGSTVSEVTGLTVRFGDEGTPFILHLEDNSTAAAIAGYVGSSEWRLPIYSYDESDVMEYYDVPSRYEIPDNSETVMQAYADDVFYSDPNRIALYYHDADIDEEYTKVGTFDATEEFMTEVEDNPVLEGWGNQIVVISAGEGR